MMQSTESIVIGALKELNEELRHKELDNPTASTKIFGGNGALDSLALVSLIADLESLIADEYDKDIVLADERAMSQKVSPFRTVKSLAEYIEQLIEAQ